LLNASALKRKKEPSFLKKRSKRLLFVDVYASQATDAKVQKSFASFLQKRRFFLHAAP
jgi:hypothetical protein